MAKHLGEASSSGGEDNEEKGALKNNKPKSKAKVTDEEGKEEENSTPSKNLRRSSRRIEKSGIDDNERKDATIVSRRNKRKSNGMKGHENDSNTEKKFENDEGKLELAEDNQEIKDSNSSVQVKKKKIKKSKIKKRNSKSKRSKDKVDNKNEDEDEETEDEEDMTEYEVSKIIDMHLLKKGKREFLVRWKGYTSKHDTWEPEEHLNCKELIDDFLTKWQKDTEARDMRTNRRQTDRYFDKSAGKRRKLSSRLNHKPRKTYYDTD